MAKTKRFTIPAPIDPEVNIRVRDSLDFSVTLPSRFNPARKYGLVFCIPGYGDNADSEYQASKFRPYIADKYDLIAVGVRYHNDLRRSSDITIDLEKICIWYGLTIDYFKNSKDGDKIIDDLFDLLQSRNIRSLDSRLAFRVNRYHRYSSFGFMPAIDHLNVLFYVIKNFNIDKKKIIAFGSSYGGYIACLMAKYAPYFFPGR